MQTKIILKQDVYGLGEEGDIKKVKAGYARNYLLPYSYAVICNKNNLAKLELEQNEINKRKQEKLEASKSIFEQINGIEIHFEENISEKGKLFGSINQNNILQALKEKGFKIEKKHIQLKAPIKEIGETELNVLFYGNINAKIKVIVTEKQQDIDTDKENSTENNIEDNISEENNPATMKDTIENQIENTINDETSDNEVNEVNEVNKESEESEESKEIENKIEGDIAKED